MKDLLRILCETDGTSGREAPVREKILDLIGRDRDYTVDALGNLIVEVKGRRSAKNKVMLAAHMDEVGVIATGFTPDGLLRFTTVGGIQPSALLGKTVRFENGVLGAVGIKPVHLCDPDERTALPSVDKMTIDIGAKDRAEAESLVGLGDAAVFTSRFTEMGDKILSKAIDDRAGCAVMVDMINKGVETDAVFVFNTMEEVGLRGSKASAFRVAPDYAIVLEGTTAADVIDAPEHKQVCVLGKGAVVNFMDRATVYDKALYQQALTVGRDNGIAVQPKTAVAGGNDAGSIHVSGKGVKTITLNVPTRYIHSPSSVCDANDLYALRALAEKLLVAFADAD